MVRLTLILSVLTAVVALLGGFRYLMDTIREVLWHKRTTGHWFSLVLIAGLCSSQSAWAATINAASCSYADVSSAVTTANVGDTVAVPSGSCAWASTLSITKGITLQGAGIGVTTITRAGLITYIPSNLATNALIRITGFTFDFDGGAGMDIRAGGTSTIQTKLRIDHNRFQNVSGQYLQFRGIRGVLDNNEFAPTAYPIRFAFEAGNDGGRTEWNNWEGVVFGQTDNNLWLEDNVFEGVSNIIMDCQVGNRYALRYNTFTLTAALFPMLDMHGNQHSSIYSCFGGEIYGNRITGGFGGTFLDHRGGRVFVFNNSTTASMTFQIREEYDESLSPVDYVGPNPPQYSQEVNGSYYWGNRINFTGSIIQPTTATGGITAGVDFFSGGTTPGVTAGTLASRPSTCATGEGYWATTQSTTDLTGMVGPNPSTPISGTLYRCIATDTWDSGASPLAYPHPLRSETGTSTSTVVMFIQYVWFLVSESAAVQVFSLVAALWNWKGRIASVLQRSVTWLRTASRIGWHATKAVSYQAALKTVTLANERMRR